MGHQRVLGVDGCRGGWVIAEADPELGNLDFRLVLDLSEVFAYAKAGKVAVVIDVPIGLPEASPRQCDLEARRLVGKRRSSVFPAPMRAALDGWEDYERASALNQAACGKKLSKQTFAILKKIRDMDQLMTLELQAVVREGHPEVTFRVLAGASLGFNKSSSDGKAERLRILADLGVRLDPTAERRSLGRANVEEDDIIDAVAMLVTARRILLGRQTVQPGGCVCQDRRGLRMEIVA